MLDIQPLDRCLNPIKVYNAATSSFDYFSCGRCLACKKHKHSVWRQRISTHIDSGKYYSLFITLTYDNEHLPLCEVDEYNNIIDITYTKFRPKNGSTYRHSLYSAFDKRYPKEILNHPWNSDDPIPHYVLARPSKDTIIYDTTNTFAICLKKDVQDFVKRLRTNLSRAPELAGKDTSFTYFICSEYGPTTFRPHYHGILFFNDYSVSEYANRRCIFDSWSKQSLPTDKYGNSISQRVTSSVGAAQYISKYVTCDISLPRLLNNPLFRPFHLQSHSIPIGSEAFDISTVPSLIENNALLRHIEYTDKDTRELVAIDVPFPSSSWRRVFPTFLFERHLDVSRISSIFQRISSILSDNAPIPDYRQKVSDLYGYGEIVHSDPERLSYFIKNRYETYFNSDSAILLETPDSIWNVLGASIPSDYLSCGFSKNDTVSKITPRDFIEDLLARPDGLELYLFGFSQNLTCVRKILRNMRLYDWCRDPNYYASLFSRFRCLCFSNKLKAQYEYQNNLLESIDFEYTPEVIFEVYPSFGSLFPRELSAITDSKYNHLSDYLFLRFGLAVEDFYDDGGVLIAYDHFKSRIHYLYERYINAYFTKKRVNTKYKYDKYLSL